MPTLVTVALIACCTAALLQWRRRQGTRRFFADRYRDPATRIPDGGGVTTLCLIIAAVAIAGAAFVARQYRTTHRPAAPRLCFLLDCSPSMLAASRRGTRLAEAKEMVTAIMDALPECELCLVSFAGNAIVDYPSSRDRRAFRQALAAVEPSPALAAGSSPSQALQALMGILPDTPQESAHTVLIMLSDGEINDPNPLLLDIPWITRSYPLLHILTGIPGQDRPVPNPLGPQWLSDPDSGAVATSRADDQALKTLAALSPQAAEFFSVADSATSISERIRQLAGGDKGAHARHASQLLGLIALAALFAAMWPRRATQARRTNGNKPPTPHATKQNTARRDTAHTRRSAALPSALLALLLYAGNAIADNVPANLHDDDGARAAAIAAIRENVAQDDCAGAERARLLSNWSALLIVEAAAKLRAGAPALAAQHATAARELSREALRLQPGQAATRQNLAAAWRVLQEAQTRLAKDAPSNAGEEDGRDLAATADAQPAEAPQNNGSKDKTLDAQGAQDAGAHADGAANAGEVNAADTARNDVSASAAGAEAPVGTWRDLQLQRHHRPPRPAGVKPW